MGWVRWLGVRLLGSKLWANSSKRGCYAINQRPPLSCYPMEGADRLMEQALFLGTYPGLTEAMLQRELGIMLEFAR